MPSLLGGHLALEPNHLLRYAVSVQEGCGIKQMKPINPSPTVAYRHMQLQTKDGPVSGFVLWYEKQEDAIRFFDFVKNYLEERVNSKSISIEFNREGSDHYGLALTISVRRGVLMTQVSCIPELYIAQIKATLASYGYTFILAGYVDGSQELLVPNCSYVTSSLLVDGDLIVGKSLRAFPLEILDRVVAGGGKV